MRRTILLATLLIVVLVFSSCVNVKTGSEPTGGLESWEENGSAPDIQALVDEAQQIADTIVQNYGTTSVQYALRENGKLLISGSSGPFSLADGRAVKPDDMYGIGSVSKMYVTAAVMVLCDRGLVDINKPLTTYIPEFTMADERYVDITVRMLMNHTSGLYGTRFGATSLFDDPDTTARDNLLQLLARQPLKANPGALFLYCNDGFALLEIVVERVSGMGYSEFIAEHFSKPLNLVNTKTPQDQFDRESRLAKTYIPIHEGALPPDTVNVMGTGGIYSTAEELSAFGQVLMGSRPDILSKDSALAMQNTEFPGDVWLGNAKDVLFSPGLGWDRVDIDPFAEHGVKVLMKDGDTMVYHAVIVVLPDHGLSMAVVSSGGDSRVNTCFAETIIHNLLRQKGSITQDQKSPITHHRESEATMPKELEAFSGLYAMPSFSADVVVNDGLLTIGVRGIDGMLTATYAGDGVFVTDDGSEALRFVQHKDGPVYLQSTTIYTFPGVGQNLSKKLLLQKVDTVKVPDAILEAWSERAGCKYYLVSEKPTSQMFCIPGFFLTVTLDKDFSEGYAVGGVRIIDENHAANVLNMRDVNDIELINRSGVEYLVMGERMYINENDIGELTEQTAFYQIGTDGLATYYAIGESLEGKTISVLVPEEASFAVYDQSDTCINFSVVSQDNSTLLPAGGKIVLIGDANAEFRMTYR